MKGLAKQRFHPFIVSSDKYVTILKNHQVKQSERD